MKNYMNLIEEISLNAWPAHKMQLYDGWLLRFSHNYTHRTNCVTPIAQSSLPLDEKISYCQEEYNKVKTPTIFKISPLIDTHFDQYLEQLGYHIEHATEVMTMPMEAFRPFPTTTGIQQPQIIIQNSITDDWIHNLFHLNGTTNPTHIKIVPSMFKAIPKTTIVAGIWQDGKMIASGLGILDREHIGLYAIYVDSCHRQKHLGAYICTSILTKAKEVGATHAYLQVVAGNSIAKHLYEQLGFRYFYTYWFRVK